MAEQVKIRASVAKVSSFDSKGGGIEIKLQMEDDWEMGGIIAANRHRMADITIDFAEGQKDLEFDEETQEELPMTDG